MNDDIIHKVLEGKASEEEAAQVAIWFKEPNGNLELIRRIDADLQREWKQRYPYGAGWRGTMRRMLSRAAIVLLIIGGCVVTTYSAYRYFIEPYPVSEQIAYTSRGERTQVILQDGTHIVLNSASQLSFPSRFSLRERRIRLEGEAYFEVSKNKHRPFIVEMGNTTVTVLGTRFNAQSYCDTSISVMLDEGSVRFSAPNIEDVTLVPGEMVCYDAQTAEARVRTVPLQVAGAWRNHRIEVSNMPLAEVAAMLERNYDVSFSVRSDRCYRHSFTFSMGDESLKQVLRRMDQLSPLTFRYDERSKMVEVY